MEQITISPITRIEGHAKVTIQLDDNGQVAQSFFHTEQFRGFEKFCQGRVFYEMPQITPRVCGICPVSHHLAASKAVDQLVSAVPTPTAHKLRELMHMGQYIQSHGMHFFELAGPDFILGFDADPAIRNVVGVIQANPELAVKAVKLRAYGQEIIRRLGGRRVSPIFGVPGGVAKPLQAEDREWMRSNLADQIGTVQAGIALFKSWMEANQQTMDEFAVFSSAYMGMVSPDGALELYDGQIRLVDKNLKLLEEYDPSNYLDVVAEHVEPYTYLKFPFYKKMGWPNGIYRVGPLGRLNVSTHISTPIAQKEMLIWKGLNGGKAVEGTLYFHYARLIETLYALERAQELIEDPEIMSTDVVAPTGSFVEQAVGSLEAPRGTLFHHYWIDKNGLMTAANLIVATGHNAWAMSHSVDMVARKYVEKSKLTEGMLNRVEAAIRAYDPCLSCSTHATGQMPMIVELRDSQGELLDSIRRD